MISRISLIVTLAAVLVLTGCGPSQQETAALATQAALQTAAAIPTAAPSRTPTVAPSATQTPTQTPEPTLTPTITPSPSPTVPPIPERQGVIYFTSDREGSFDVFKLDLSDGAIQRVTSASTTDEFFPHRSSDGQWLSYWSSSPQNKFNNALVLLNLSDGKSQEIKKAMGWSSWSPDSRKIVVVEAADFQNTSGNAWVDFNLFTYKKRH